LDPRLPMYVPVAGYCLKLDVLLKKWFGAGL